MSGSYWEQVMADDLAVPTDRPLADLTAELTRMLGDADPSRRDGLALPTLGAWVARGVYDDLLPGLGDGMAAGLLVGLGEEGTDSVFRRSFSALVLGACIQRDNRRPLVLAGKVLEWGDRLATWLLREQDTRGFVPGKGWAHAMSHGADAIATLARSPHLSAPELTVLLDVVADRVLAPGPVWTHGEHDRMARAVVAVLRRELVPVGVLEPWVNRLAAGADPERSEADDPYTATGNAQALLRSLYLLLALGPRHPATRSDLLLVLVEALRRTNGVLAPVGAH
ncbi:DUF2785 domain-containing protein [Nocardioides bruguierae]|uniref:DUF2785 domain-containing protein n=1 Tax=Nocardioides bruguierae TaxID=2945102 RepID=A0A9X2D4S5_9ACTN|nr:DUF2785 domain-containing protein [Nocardioides bruguierae]MCM0619218.1 DUF2785 domain-containing protein [Nocardioides bruguierae]